MSARKSSAVFRHARRPVSRATMLSDICLAVVLAATVPGLMWLGVAGGF